MKKEYEEKQAKKKEKEAAKEKEKEKDKDEKKDEKADEAKKDDAKDEKVRSTFRKRHLDSSTNQNLQKPEDDKPKEEEEPRVFALQRFAPSLYDLFLGHTDADTETSTHNAWTANGRQRLPKGIANA